MSLATTIKHDTVFTTTEASEYLGFAEDTVRQYIKRGLIKAEKLGPINMVKKSECDRYLREKRKVGQH